MIFKIILMIQNVNKTKKCIDKGSEPYNGSIKSCLKDNGIEMYSAHNEKKNMLLLNDLLEP